MSELKILVQRIGLIGINNAILSLSGIILLPIITKSISIDDYGIWVQINVTIGLIPSIILMGLPYTMVRYLASADKREDIQEGFFSIVAIVAAMSLVCAAIMYLLAGPISTYLFDGNILIARILAIIIVTECLSTISYNYFRTFQQIMKYSIFLFIKTCLSLTLISYFIFSGYGILGGVIGILATNVLINVIMGYYIISEIGIKLPGFRDIREYLAFGVPTIISNLSSWIIGSSDRYFIGLLLGTALVGYYSPGYMLGNCIGMFISPLAFILPPALSKYYDEKDLSALNKIYKYSLKYYIIISIPAMFGISLLSKHLLQILTTPEIASEGYLITPFIALSALMAGVYAIFVQVIVLEKRTQAIGIIWIIVAAIDLGLNVALVPAIGIIGAATTTLAANALALILTTYYSNKYYMIDIDLSYIFKSLIASVAMSAAIILADPAGLIEILGVVCIGAVIYIVVMMAFKAFNSEEIDFIRKLAQV